MVRLAQWARVLAAGGTGLRAGAWYSVVARTPREVQVVVRGRSVSVPRAAVELRDTPPDQWTVVRPAGQREPYMVCPGCRHRMALPERGVPTARCSRCNQAFAIGGAAARPSGAELKADRRVARRRTSAERRKRPRAAKDRRTKPERRQRTTTW